MIITLVPHGLDLGVSHGHRSPGLHVSEIYGSLYRALEPKRYDTGKPMDLNRLEAGLAFESILEEGLKRRIAVERPGEFVSDEGIICSPDLIIYNGAIRVGEVKLTWLSSREVPRERSNGFPPKFSKYFCQMLAYCHILETPHARLMAYFVNGPNYYKGRAGEPGDAKGSGPELLAWNVEFSAREIKENWQMLINHAHHTRLL